MTTVSRSRVLTIPNLISVGRLACVPWFLVLLLRDDEPVAAGVLLAVLGATDWVDGYIARRFDQGSELGKVLDPVADRVLLVAAGVALLIDGSVPVWLGVVVLAREALIIVATLALALAGARRIDVQWAGKAGTLALMFALPGFLLADQATGVTEVVLRIVTWVFTIGGLAFSWYAVAEYVPLARAALSEGRADRAEAARVEAARVEAARVEAARVRREIV
ncbi:MAG: CDP-alcohol phosphatidyltransferase family protein [Acidimicrobiia bacterium]